MDEFFEFLFETALGRVLLVVFAVILVLCVSSGFLDCVCHNEECAENCALIGCAYYGCDCSYEDCICGAFYCYGCSHRTCSLCSCDCIIGSRCQCGTCMWVDGVKTVTLDVYYNYDGFSESGRTVRTLEKYTEYANGTQIFIPAPPESVTRYFNVKGYGSNGSVIFDENGVLVDDVLFNEQIRKSSSAVAVSAVMEEKNKGTEVLIRFVVPDELEAEGVVLNSVFATVGATITFFPDEPSVSGKTFVGWRVVGKQTTLKIHTGDKFHLYTFGADPDALTVELEPVFD